MVNEELRNDFNSMITCLQEAERAAMWAFWRERFNTNHPDHVRREEVESPTRYATANFFAAKAVYCANRNAFDQIYEEDFKDTKLGELFMAMRRTIENEMDQEMEDVIKKPTPEPEEELDEDEAYVRETEALANRDMWDGDDYLGDEDDIDWGDEDE